MGLHHPVYTSYREASNIRRASLCSSTSQTPHEPLKGLLLAKVRTQELKPNSVTTSHSRSVRHSGYIRTGLSMDNYCVLEILSVNKDPESSSEHHSMPVCFHVELDFFCMLCHVLFSLRQM